VPSFVDRVYVVDDCSTDGSWSVITRHADRSIGDTDGDGPDTPVASADLLADGGVDPAHRIVAVRHGENRGRGGAVTTGYRLALADGLDVVAVMDGDGQMDPDVLDRILDPVVSGDADYAKGNRLVSPTHWRSMTGWRLFGNVSLTVLTRIASGYWGMRDPQNGYTAISVEALEQLDLDGVYEDYGFLNDILIRLSTRGMRVTDVPMRAVYGEESSGIRYASFVPNLSALLLGRFCWRLWIKYVRRSVDHRRTVPVAVASGDVPGLVSAIGREGTPTLLATGALASLAFGCLVVVSAAVLYGLHRDHDRDRNRL